MLSLLCLCSMIYDESEIISRHCNGNVKEMTVHLSKEGTVNKLLFFENGTIAEVFQEQNLKRHGACTRFWSNGIVMSQTTWEQGSLKQGVMYSPSGALIGEMEDVNIYTQITVSLKTQFSRKFDFETKCGAKYSTYVVFNVYIGSDGALDFILINPYPPFKDLDLTIYNNLAGVDFSADVPLNGSEGIFFSMMMHFHLQ